MLLLSTILLSVFITTSLIPIMVRLAEKYSMVDYPNPRKVHIRPIPRIGGVAMAAGAAVPILLFTVSNEFIRAYLAGAGILVIFGMVDDMKGLGYKAKFTGQFIAALVAVFYGGVRIDSIGTLLPQAVLLPEWLAVVFSIVAIVGVTNAINLADGLDGLAGGISLLSFCAIGYLAYLTGNSAILLLSLSLAGAIFGFLRFNTHPATLFMGDTGSQLLGFSAIVLIIKITQGNTPLSPVLPLIILGFPVLDTLTVMVERIREGRSPFSPDKNHFHHRLIRLGLYHSEAVFAIYLIQSMMIVSAIFFKYENDWLLLIFYVAFSVFVISSFVVTDRTGFRIKRNPLIDHVIKGPLRRIKEEHWIIRIAFGIMKILIPLLFLCSCLIPANIPGYVSVFVVCFSLFITAARLWAKKHLGFCLRIAIYLTVPLILYLAEEERALWISSEMFTAYHLFFGISAFFVFLTVKYSRRTKGFRPTTMDFLIIFIAVVVPNLPDQWIQSHHLGLLAVEIIVVFFSYEVLITELRGQLDAVAASTVTASIIIALRGIAGF